MRLTADMLTKLRRTYEKGGDLTELLKRENIQVNSLAIEVIYELQAGSYTKYVEENPLIYREFVAEIAKIIRPFLFSHANVLDVGIGEGSTFIPIVEELKLDINSFGIDISWSRLSQALVNSRTLSSHIRFAVGNMLDIPLPDRCMDFVLTVHALEPNGGKEIEMLKELARIAKKYVVLVEPDFTTASESQKERMKKLSYICSLDSAIDQSKLKLYLLN